MRADVPRGHAFTRLARCSSLPRTAGSTPYRDARRQDYARDAADHAPDRRVSWMLVYSDT